MPQSPSEPNTVMTITPEQLQRGTDPECGIETDLRKGFCLPRTNCRFDYEGRVKRHVIREWMPWSLITGSIPA
jgi:hypothetical protein